MDSTDDEYENKTADGTSSFGPVSNCITARMPTQRKDTHYNMKHKNRGLALIFNHETFESRLNLGKRLGTNQDVARIEPMLIELGFQVFVYKNNNLAALNRRIREAVNHDHTHYDCFVMVVLTHGDTNDLLYANDSIYSSANLWLPFTADSCRTLAGKPKLFFIQACRGPEFMSPVNLQADFSRSCNGSYKIPSHADFLFFYSSSPGYVSLRNTETGTWFIQALCREFEINAYKHDFFTLLTLVIQSVAIDCEAYLLNKKSLPEEQKQIPCFTSNLTRLVRFEKKTNQIPYPESLRNVEVTVSKPSSDDAVAADIKNIKITDSAEISNNPVVTGNEKLVVKTSSISISSQEQPTHTSRVEDHGQHQTHNRNMDEEKIDFSVQLKTLKSSKFLQSVLFSAFTNKKC